MDSFVPQKVQEAIFNQILERPENKVCADCPNKSPTWASIDFGVFICLRCSGAHRRLSPVVTRVRSAKIDDWKMDHIEMVAAVGNGIGNDYWECNLPSYFKKPDISTSLEDVFEMVKNKYVKALYADKTRMNPVKEFLEAKKDGQTTAGSFNQAKMAQKSKGPEIKVTQPTTTQTKPVDKKPVPTKGQDLLNFDDDGDFGEFKSAPEKSTKLDIPKPDVEVKFVSNNGKSTIDLWDTQAEAKGTGPVQKTKSFDPFSFEQPQNPPTLSNQKSNSTPSDSNKLYDLYKTGNQMPQNTMKVNGTNYSGGQSNYAFLDMMGGNQQTQQNRFGQQQQQGYGFQNGMNTQQGMNNQYYGGGGMQSKPFGGGYGGQPTGGMGSNGFSTNNGGFGMSTGGGGFGSNTGGGFGTNNSSGGFSMSTNNNSGGGFGTNSNGFNSFGSKPTFGTQPQQQPQQQPFTFGQPTTNSTATTTTSTSFNFNTVNNSQGYTQPTSVNTGFSFL